MARFHLARVFEKSFLERNQKLIGAIGIAALLAGSAFALLLTGGVFARTYHVTAYFSDAAGLQSGDPVTVAGLKAGTVKGLDISHGQVAVENGSPDSEKPVADLTSMRPRSYVLESEFRAGRLLPRIMCFPK